MQLKHSFVSFSGMALFITAQIFGQEVPRKPFVGYFFLAYFGLVLCGWCSDVIIYIFLQKDVRRYCLNILDGKMAAQKSERAKSVTTLA